jgi:DNA replication and repair protein RecF
LLDDIFDKLDDLRVRKLMEMVSHQDFGQIFITDTGRERVLSVFKDINTAVTLFEVAEGEVKHA